MRIIANSVYIYFLIFVRLCDNIPFFQLSVFLFYGVEIFSIFHCISHAFIVLKLYLKRLFRTNNFFYVFHAILEENGKKSFILRFWLIWRTKYKFWLFQQASSFYGAILVSSCPLSHR